MKAASEKSACDRIAELVRRRTGLLTTRAQTDLPRAAKQVIERVGLRDLRELESRLAAGALWEELLDQVTVRETYFFRNPEHFALIAETILPELQAAREPVRRIRLWSAGCASGEEAYSLAMLLYERGILEDAWVVGTDVSERAITTARAGRYREWSFRALDSARIERYFRQEQQEYVLTEAIRRHVSFERRNLVEDTDDEFGPFDLIMCRNVMIYFDRASIARLEERLFDRLAPGGWLIAGPSDPPLGQRAPFEVVVLKNGVCYRRKAQAVFAPRPSLPQLESRSPRSHSPLPRPPLAAARTAPAQEQRPRLDHLREQAATAFERADYARTVELARNAPEDLELATLLVRATWNLEGAPAAERICALALRKHSMSAELHYLHAMTLMEGKQLAEALRAVRCALYADRSLMIAHFAHGAILERLNDLEGARRAYRNTYDSCKKHRPDDVVALGDGIVAEGLCNAAAHALKELAKRCPA